MRCARPVASSLAPLAVLLVAGAAVPAGGTAKLDAELTGRAIYDRFLENRFRESFQELRAISRDPGGNEQVTEFTISFQDLRDDDDEPTDGMNGRTLIEVSAPFDMRHTAYLILAKDPGPNDEFVYQPSQRRVRRVDLKNTSLLGTDYTFNDISFQNLDDAEYRRLPDELLDGESVYVVEAVAKDHVDTEFPKTVSYFDRQRFVPLRVRYWDAFDVEVKEQVSPRGELELYGSTWVATESTMRDLRQGTSSSLLVDALDDSPDFHRKVFSLQQLSRGH